jgi:group I intron endonuclease
MKTGVYKIVNTVNGKTYVGSASHSILKRWRVHKFELRRGSHTNQHLQRAWIKYGEDSFVFEIVETVKPDKCREREQYWLNLLNPEYNILKIAGSASGYKHTPESLEKMRIASTGRKQSESARKKIGDHFRGRPISQEHKDKIRAFQLGRKKGPRSVEHNEKLRLALTGQKRKPFSDETKARMSIAAKKREALKKLKKQAA